jgi:hypothetical protein
MGEEDFVDKALDKYDRREKRQSEGVNRVEDRYFEPEEKVIWEFERRHGLRLEEIELGTHRGKRLRGELLVLLKDWSGLKYTEIMEIEIFKDIRATSLPKLYRDAKNRQKEQRNRPKTELMHNPELSDHRFRS